MGLWRFLLILALSFGSVLPHCATAMPVAQAAPHHAGMTHDQEQPSKAHVSDACVGCATPIRLSFPERAAPIAATPVYLAFHAALTTRVATLDPPPPRQAA
ncbi:MAG: hypothetical protein ABI898_00585 [Sphingomonadales bacterium]